MVKSDVLGLQPSLSGCLHLQSAHLHFTLLRFPAPGFSSRHPEGRFCPSLILPLPLGIPPPSFSPGLEQSWLHSQQKGGILCVLHPQPGTGGSWEAPCAHPLCLEGREGTKPRCFEREQNSRGARVPRWGEAVQLGPLLELWGWAAEPGGSRRWGCVRQGGAERKDGGRRRLLGGIGIVPIPRGVTTASLRSQHRCRFRFISGVPTLPLVTGF